MNLALEELTRRRAALSAVIPVLLFAVAACSAPTTPSVKGDGTTTPAGARITSVWPEVASTVVPTMLAISGSGFVAETTVSVGGQVIPARVILSDRIEVILPPSPAAVVDIVVANPGGHSARLEGALRFEAGLPFDPVEVRLTGHVVQARGGAPVDSIEVRFHPLSPPVPQVFTDQHGRFELVGTTLQSTLDIFIRIERPQDIVAVKRVSRLHTGPLVMQVVDPVVIGAGESIDSALLTEDHPSWCGFNEDVRCVRVIVEGSAGEQIDLTLSAVDGQPVDFRDAGLRPLPFPRPYGSAQRITVPPMELWIAGGPANFTLTATRR